MFSRAPVHFRKYRTGQLVRTIDQLRRPAQRLTDSKGYRLHSFILAMGPVQFSGSSEPSSLTSHQVLTMSSPVRRLLPASLGNLLNVRSIHLSVRIKEHVQELRSSEGRVYQVSSVGIGNYPSIRHGCGSDTATL